MKFKHTLNVFVDNFSVTYKQLLYRLVVGLIAFAICYAGLYPFIKNELIASPAFNSLITGLKTYVLSLLKGEVNELGSASKVIQDAFKEFIFLLKTKTVQFVLSGLLILLVVLIEKWFTGLGNYATACVVNDKMALRTNAPFLGTMIKNIKEAAIYNAIYVPLSVVYDLLVCAIVFCAVFFLIHSFLPILFCIFLFLVIIVFAISVKMTFTADWLPALIRGKKGQKNSLKYAFSRKGKNTFNVLSNFVVLVLLIFGLNAAALFCTFGVGLLLTIPSSFVMLVSFELVNYYDREEIKYFVDKNTIIKPAHEHTPTREEFFKGEND